MAHKSTFSLLLTAISLFATVAGAQTEVKPGFNLFSPEDDIKLGQESATKAEQELPILNDAQVNAYVNRIGQRLAAHAGGPKFVYHFHVINASDINAFALPGGFIYVNRGVLDTARNEGEVAGVMAHEVSHVALRHGTHQSSKASLAKAGLRVLGDLALIRGGVRDAIAIDAIGNLGMNALFLKYSRELESQADVRGSQILAASGYSPVDMANFFKNLERVDPSRTTNFLSDHPAPPDRIARIQQEAKLLKVTDKPTENIADLRAVQTRLATYAPAKTTQQIQQASSSSKSGKKRASQPAKLTVPAPSATFSSYTSRAGGYRISYPNNWRVYEGPSKAVTIAPPGGLRNGESSEIFYGAIVNHYEPFGNQSYGKASPQQATQDLVTEIQRDYPYLHAEGHAPATEILRGTDPSTGIDERVTVVTRQIANNDLLFMLFVTPNRDAANYQHVLDTMTSSLQASSKK